MQNPSANAPVLSPTYIALDTSTSIKNSSLDHLLEFVPLVVEKLIEADLQQEVRAAIISFSDRVEVSLPLCNLATQMALPTLMTGGLTYFGPVFELLRTRIERDVEGLRADGYLAARPVVILVTDGAACDEWSEEFRALTDYDALTGVGFELYPVILPVGLGTVEEEDLERLASPYPARDLLLKVDNFDDISAASSAVIGRLNMVADSVFTSGLSPRSRLWLHDAM